MLNANSIIFNGLKSKVVKYKNFNILLSYIIFMNLINLKKVHCNSSNSSPKQQKTWLQSTMILVVYIF